MLIFAAIFAIFVYGMIAAMLGTILPDLSERFGIYDIPHAGPGQVLSSLDPRVDVSIPVAGYTNIFGRDVRVGAGEAGDLEQNGTDFLTNGDFDTLTALRAPRPTLEINNAEDDCCFRAPL